MRINETVRYTPISPEGHAGVLVEIDGVAYIDEDIPGFYGFSSFVGFTAGTGGATNNHFIDSLVVTELVCQEE